MNEKFNKNAKVEQSNKMILSLGEEKGLIVKDPLYVFMRLSVETTFTNPHKVLGIPV